MNMPNKFLLIGLGLAIMAAPVSADVDLSSLFSQVQQQQSQLNNHDARITNNSKDIKALQDNTSTAPASDSVSVPVVDPTPVAQSVSTAPVVAPVTAPATTPAPKTIVAVDNTIPPGTTLISNDETGAPLYCAYTYSDGTTSSQWGYPKRGFACKQVGDAS